MRLPDEFALGDDILECLQVRQRVLELRADLDAALAELDAALMVGARTDSVSTT